MTGEPRHLRVLRVAARLFYRLLLVAYPASFRREAGDEAARLFAHACVDSWRSRGLRGVLGRIARAVVDVPRDGIAERRAPAAWAPAAQFSLRAIGALVSDIRYGVRSIVRRPVFSATIVVTLALGIGANTAMFSVVDATLLRPLPYPDADRVVYVRARDAGASSPRAPWAAELLRWAPLVDSFQRVEALNWKPALVTSDRHATTADLYRVTPGYLDALGARPRLGRLLQPHDDEAGAAAVTVLGEPFWKQHFGAAPDIVGRTIGIDGAAHVVVGIVPRLPPDAPGRHEPDLYVLLPSRGQPAAQTHVRGIAWLKPSVSLAAAQSELIAVAAAIADGGRHVAIVIERPGNIFWDLSEYRDSQLALLIAVFLLLAVAGINVAHLLLSAARTRRAELAVRSALGAGRLRLVRLLLVEQLLLSLGGCALGVLVAWLGIRGFATLGYDVRWQTSLEAIQLDGVVVAYAIGVAMLTGLLAGFVPAWRGTAAPASESLRDIDSHASKGGRRFRGALLGVEVALSVVLLAVAGLAGRAFVQMRLADLGFAADRVLNVRLSLPEARYSLPERRAFFFEQLQARALRLPGVKAVVPGVGVRVPSGMLISAELDTAGAPTEFYAGVTFTRPGYFDLMGIPLLSGRDFLDSEVRHVKAAADIAVVVSDSLARQLWQDTNPLGREFRVFYDGPRRMRVVGVAKDVHSVDLTRPGCLSCRWHIYAPSILDERDTELVMRIADGAVPPFSALRDVIRRLDPDVPIDDGLQMADARIYDSFLQAPRFRAAIFASLAAIALALAGFGIAAVAAVSVSQRTREMGVRLALGGRPAQVRGLILREGLTPVLAGLVLGLGAALLASRAMASLLHGVSASDPSTFAAVMALFLMVAAGALWIPAQRATRVDPIRALRSD